MSPEMRIGDQERADAAAALGDHYAAGRITREEYDERSAAVWAAKTHSDLKPVFVDLPGPGVAGRSWPAPSRQPARQLTTDRGRRPRVPVLWLVVGVLVLVFVLPFPAWLVIGVLGGLWLSGCFRGGCGPRSSQRQGP